MATSNLRRPVSSLIALRVLGLLLLAAFAALLLVHSSFVPFESRHLEEDNEADYDYGENDGDHVIDEYLTLTDLTVVACIVLSLIFCSILFERVKDLVERSVDPEKIIIVERIFGELTVLGFLAMVIFILKPFLERLSHIIDEEELEEYLEHIHIAVFFIMIFFVIQVWVLMGAASMTEKGWIEMEERCRDERLENTGKARRRRSFPSALPQKAKDALRDLRRNWWYTWLLPQLRNQDDERERDQIMFSTLRNEFLLERSSEYPYRPLPLERQLSPDFSFGRYLALCQVDILTRVVEVEEAGWICFAVGTSLFYVLGLWLRQPSILAWVWVAIGWAVLLFNVVFEQHLKRVRDKYLPKRLVTMMHQDSSAALVEMKKISSKNFVLLSDEPDPDELPSWFEQDDSEIQNSLWNPCQPCFCGVPVKQQVSDWMDRGGADLYLLILQLNLVFTGVYVACLALAYIPAIIQQNGWTISVVYIVLALIPILGITYNKQRLVATLTMCLSLGSHRQLHVITDVVREMKTHEAIRTLLFICAIRRHASLGNDDPVGTSNPYYSNKELNEAAQILQHLSAEKSLTYTEVDTFFTRLGLSLTPEKRQRMILELDADGDGQITRQEFLDWYSDHMMGTMEEQARDLFQLFDEDGDGSITLSEFKNRVDALQVGFTVDEIGALVHELDHDRNGSISMEEFEYMVKKYYPRALFKRSATA